ncbi:uncharacterized protein ARMOST_11475 [Armillaria ostoyae]|uniref:Uncharacterized protein n=1 Tax=Armillaria ostoyae TaxID=47428 RepID=A0A284RH91_ARMOS|nr:uncharacterized protein ARMOST_11475 [Armillaria ostoyae]
MSMLSDQDEAYTPDLKLASFARQAPSDYDNSPRRDEMRSVMRLAYEAHEVIGTFSLGSGRPAGDTEADGQSPWMRTCDDERRSNGLALTNLLSLIQVSSLKGCIQTVP